MLDHRKARADIDRSDLANLPVREDTHFTRKERAPADNREWDKLGKTRTCRSCLLRFVNLS